MHLEEANIKDGPAGVHITMSREGRPSGEAFVELETNEDAEKALKKDKQHMGHRYIESKLLFCSQHLHQQSTRSACCIDVRISVL